MPSNALAVNPNIQPNEFCESIGKTLNLARIKKNYTLEDISKATKIRPYFLTLLEEDDFNALPSTVFTTGFIRSYCEFLNISPAPLVSSYISQSSKIEPESPFKLYMPQSSEKILSTRILVISFVTIIAASLVWQIIVNPGLISSIYSYDTIDTKSNKTKDIIKNSTHDEYLSPKNKDNSDIKSKDSAVEPDKKEILSDDISLKSPSPTLTEIPSSTNIEKPTTQEKLDFKIKAVQETWLKITNDKGKRLQVLYLKKDDIFSLTPYEENLISVGNAEHVEFVMGDKKITGPEYLQTASGFVESKKIVAPKTTTVVESMTSDVSDTVPAS